MSEETTKKEDKIRVEYETRIRMLIGNADSIKYDAIDLLFRAIPDIALLGLFMVLYFLVQTLSLATEEKVYVQLLVGSGALLISAVALYTVFFPKWDKAFSEYKAGKICKSLNYDKETKVLLTALIVMKLKQPKIELSTLYGLEPEIFTKKSLIQSLYE
jgi:hypothetical protein